MLQSFNGSRSLIYIHRDQHLAEGLRLRKGIPGSAKAYFEPLQLPVDLRHFRGANVVLTRLVVEDLIVERKTPRDEDVHHHARRKYIALWIYISEIGFRRDIPVGPHDSL